jgi:TusA-related sulfurtransferase
MMTKQIDTCGLSCPQPVLMVHQALKNGETVLDVLVDNEASRENVTRAAQSKGFNVSPVDQGEGVFRLELRP